MRTTFRIDDDLLQDLKKHAQKQKTSLNNLLNKVIRSGMEVMNGSGRPKRRFRQKTQDLGRPLVDLTKALSLAAQLEDEEIIKKLELGK